MADKRSGNATHVPGVAAMPKVPSKITGLAYTDHYLDGCPIEEVDGIRVVQDPEVGPQSASMVCDFNDPLDLPAASGTRHTTKGTTGSVAFVANDPKGQVQLTTGAVNTNGESFIRDAVGKNSLPAAATPTTPSKRMWFTCNITIPAADSVTDGAILVGLVIDNYGFTVIGTLPTDGLFFKKLDTASDFSFEVRKNATSTTTATAGTFTNILAAAGVTLTLGVPVELSCRIDTNGALYVYVNGILVGALANNDANMPYTPSSAGHDLTPGFGRFAGAGAVARKLNIDYYLAGVEI